MDISVDDISQDGDELELGISVGGYHEVELEESDTVGVSIDDILGKIDDDKLLDHVGASGIQAYAKEHDIKLGESEGVTTDTVIKWLLTSDDGQLFAVAAAVTAILRNRGQDILDAHMKE